jgi:hypothetical protein
LHWQVSTVTENQRIRATILDFPHVQKTDETTTHSQSSHSLPSFVQRAKQTDRASSIREKLQTSFFLFE